MLIDDKRIGQDIAKAVSCLQSGLLLGFPTETVYGLGADALNETAVQKVFAAKGRPMDRPLIVHVAGLAQLADWAIEIPDWAYRLGEAFWPGPLTLVLKKHPRVPAVVTGGQDTIALRVPNHPLTLACLHAFKGGMVGPSANRYQCISPTLAQDVQEELGERLGYVLDGGPCEVGIESTIVQCDAEGVHVLRQGMVTVTALREALPAQARVFVRTGSMQSKVPGAGAVHYAPQKPVFRLSSEALQAQLERLGQEGAQGLADRPGPLAVISFSPKPVWLPVGIWQQVPKDARVYAQNLYRWLRAFDHSQAAVLWIEEVPEDELWCAVADRLSRASKTLDLYIALTQSIRTDRGISGRLL